MRKRKSFTLIELVMVIVILSVLAAVALPKFFDLQEEAKNAAELGVVGGVRAGIATYYAKECVRGDDCAWPDSLSEGESVAVCSPTNKCFEEVLEMDGITEDDWERLAVHTYKGPGGGIYIYTPADGKFALQ